MSSASVSYFLSGAGQVGPAGGKPEAPEGGAGQSHQAEGHFQKFNNSSGGQSQGELSSAVSITNNSYLNSSVPDLFGSVIIPKILITDPILPFSAKTWKPFLK